VLPSGFQSRRFRHSPHFLSRSKARKFSIEMLEAVDSRDGESFIVLMIKANLLF
jgi:hypothetical protein